MITSRLFTLIAVSALALPLGACSSAGTGTGGTGGGGGGSTGVGGGTGVQPDYDSRLRRVGRRVSMSTGTAVQSLQISQDATTIVFEGSNATTLHPAIPFTSKETRAVFTLDVATGKHTWESVRTGGGLPASSSHQNSDWGGCCSPSQVISADGRRVTFVSGYALDGTGSESGSYLRDRDGGTTRMVSFRRVNPGFRPVISSDGNSVLFEDAIEMRDGGPPGTNPSEHWIYDVPTGSRTWVRAAAGGQLKPRASAAALSADGNLVAFLQLTADGLPSVYSLMLVNRASGALETVVPHTTPSANIDRIAMSDDGGYLAYNTGQALFWLDRQAAVTRRVSKDPAGMPVSRAGGRHFNMTPDGRYVVFAATNAMGLVGKPTIPSAELVYRYDSVTDEVVLISALLDGSPPAKQANCNLTDYRTPAIDATGQVIAFHGHTATGCSGGLSATLSDGLDLGIWVWDNRQ